MTNLDERMRELRALLTEVLPYELPFGFTNENLFLSELKSDQLNSQQQAKLKQLRHSNSGYTKPFLYKIRRSHRTKNTLGLIHPTVQLRLAKFYADFEHTIIQSCSKSTVSVRYPSETLKIYTKGSQKDVRKRWSEALPDVEPGSDIDAPYSSSYFSYRKYMLLDRFFSSNELVRIESRFSQLRTLDVSRCFFNIYTHSICWAVKEKDFSKKNSKRYSFEQQFDELMQHANYNETAGILVGPEVSRIFAEIILQRIDVDIERTAEKLHGLKSEIDYTVRRYVDDYHVFANEKEVLDKVEGIISDLLEAYKLFLNIEKVKDYERPFVTAISRVKFEVSQVCAEMYNTLTCELDEDESDTNANSVRRSARLSLDALRHIGGSERAALISSTAEVYTTLEGIVRHFKKMDFEQLTETQYADILGRLRYAVRVLFYLLSVDYRVPPIIRASHIVKEIAATARKLPTADHEALSDYLAYELSELLSVNYHEAVSALPLEVSNTFLLGLMVNPEVFMMQESPKRLLDNALSGKHDCYFAILIALHALNSLNTEAMPEKEDFEARVSNRIKSTSFDFQQNCEDYLIFCDFLSCPAIDANLRWETFGDKLGGQPLSKANFETLCLSFRHTNWDDQGVSFAIVKRRLPPVYFSG